MYKATKDRNDPVVCDPAAQQLQLRLGHVQLAVNGQLICPLEHAMRDEPAEGRGQTRAQPVPFPRHPIYTYLDTERVLEPACDFLF